MTAYILTEQEHTQITEHYERLYAEIDLSEWDGKAAQLLRDTLAMLKAMKPVHVHEWFRTIEMKPTEMRCISCGTWGSTLPEESAPAAVSGWEPIDSAPKDGTEILVHFKSVGVRQVSWCDECGDSKSEYALWRVDDNKHGPYPLRGYRNGDETGWMPLPPAPTGEPE